MRWRACPTTWSTRSLAYGEALKAAIIDWSEDDGGAVIENMGFPMAYDADQGPGHWVPTSAIRQQQLPLLPVWGNNRTFAMPERRVLRPAAAARLQRGSVVRLLQRGEGGL